MNALRMLGLPAAIILSALLRPGIATARTAAWSLRPAAESADQSVLQTVGVAKPILDPSGVKLSVLVTSYVDQPRDITERLDSGGRWVALGINVTNVGTRPFDLSASDFQIMTPLTTVISPTTLPDQTDQLADMHLSPGDSASGRLLFALPAGAMVQSVMFQAPGTAQWLVALLTP
jgi:Domain of unknown function (DUF4352)